MKKTFIKAIAGCAAVCFMAGMVIVGGGNKPVSAEDNYLANYTFEDGNTGDFVQNGITREIVDDLNSNAGLEYGQTVSGSNCLKVSTRDKGNDWWERNGLVFDLEKLTPGVRYSISVDVYHDNGEIPEKNYSEQRAFKLAVYFPNGTNSYEEGKNSMYNQVGSLKGAQKGDWERLEGTFVVEDDAATLKGGKLIVAMMYPEEAGEGSSVSYKDKNTEDYYVDNFIVKEYVAPTPEPAATPAPTPTQDPNQGVIITPEEESLEVGYEETVGNLTYVVNGNFTVAVKEFDNPKSKLNIPATVILEDLVYKVTEIKANAFKSDSDIKSLTIGANVAKIGKNAFYKCSSLKKVTIKSVSIKSIGKGAFKGINKKATVKVPKKKKAAYKKILKKAGLPSKAKVK